MRTVFKPLSFVLFIVLFLGGCATMESRWKDTEGINTIAAYEEFLRRYPEGTLANEARSRIEKLYFEQAQAENTISSYEGFLRRYNRGKLADEARSRIEALYLQGAKDTNTIAAYEDFLRRYPTGKFAAEVRAMIEELYFEQTKAKNTIEAYQEFLRKYPQSEFAAEAEDTVQKLQAEDKLKRMLETAKSPLQLEGLLKTNPDMAEFILPKLEQAILQEIQSKGVGGRFLIKEIMPQGGLPGSMTLVQIGKGPLIVEMEFPGDGLPIINNQPFAFGNFCLHRYKGRVELDMEGDIYTFISEDDKLNRLTFVMVPRIGYVYLRGKGRVILKDGKEVKLGD